MFDTMTLTKAVGSVCGALLFLLLAGWAAESLYHVGGGHGEHDQAYVIDTGSDDAADAPAAEEGPDFATLMAGADAAKGASSWSKCRACHALEEGKNGVGPYLAGIMGRDVAAASGFGYSDALKAIEGSWTAEQMDAWLTDPKSFAPGNKMTFAGIRSPEERANLIAYLGENSPGWVLEVSAPAGAAEEAPASEEAAVPAEEAAARSEQEAAGAATPAAPQSADEADATPAEAAPAEAAESPAADSPIAAAFAQADPARGQAAFRVCAACHAADKPQNRVGPHLMGVLGRDVASVEGFAYSDALKGLEGAWTLEALDEWLTNPRAYAPGNKMGFPGVKDLQARADIIAYIGSIAN